MLTDKSAGTQYSELLKHGEHTGEVEILRNRATELYSSQNFPRKAQELVGVNFVVDFSSSFQYPKFDTNGTVAINQVNFLAVNHPLST